MPTNKIILSSSEAKRCLQRANTAGVAVFGDFSLKIPRLTGVEKNSAFVGTVPAVLRLVLNACISVPIFISLFSFTLINTAYDKMLNVTRLMCMNL